MELSFLNVLNNISSFFHLSFQEKINFEPVKKYYRKVEEILNLLKPVLDDIFNAEMASNEPLQKILAGLNQSVDVLRELFENCHSLMSKVYFVFQAESLIEKIRNTGLEILELLKSFDGCLPVEISVASLEHYVQKLRLIGHEQMSSVITKAIRDLVQGSEPSSESLAKIADSLSLMSNQELLIEAVALEKLKENAEQTEINEEDDCIGQMMALVTHMHDSLVIKKRSQSHYPVQIPADFCCPLSLELMTDPVIVLSGQTYERDFIKKWIDLGLAVCPKTRQTLVSTNLIPNYNVKALIVSWCESNNVKLPDPMKSLSLNQPSFLLKNAEPGAPGDSLVISHSTGNQPTSPVFTWSSGSAGEKRSCSEIHQDRVSPSHPCSSSDNTLSGLAVNRHGLDIDRLLLKNSNDRLSNSGERSLDSGGQVSRPPSIKELSNAVVTEKKSSEGHNHTSSASSTPSNSEFSGAPDNRNEASSQATPYSGDASGEVTSEPKLGTNLSAPRRDPESSSVLETRSCSQTIWCRPSERFVPRIVSSPAIETRADLSGVESHVQKLIEDLRSDSLDAQRNATVELRFLARHNTDNRIVIANCGAISLLVDLLRSTDTKIQENAVTALLNLSINGNNKTAIANADAIEPLIHVLRTGSPEAKENSAATLYSLSVILDNKIRIGKLGAIKPLVDLLGNGTPSGKKDATTALFNLSLLNENKARIVEAGAVKYLVELLDPAAGMVDKAVAVLSNLSTLSQGQVAISQEGGIPLLVDVVELGSARAKENAAAALQQLCKNCGRFCHAVLREGAVPPLVALSQSGTARAKEKALELLRHFRNQQHGNAASG